MRILIACETSGMASRLVDGTLRYDHGHVVESLQPCAGWLEHRLAYLAQGEA